MGIKLLVVVLNTRVLLEMLAWNGVDGAWYKLKEILMLVLAILVWNIYIKEY